MRAEVRKGRTGNWKPRESSQIPIASLKPCRLGPSRPLRQQLVRVWGQGAARLAVGLGAETGPVGDLLIAAAGGILGGLLGNAAGENLKSEVFQLEGFSYGPSTVTVPFGGEPGPGCMAYKGLCAEPVGSASSIGRCCQSHCSSLHSALVRSSGAGSPGQGYIEAGRATS